MTVLLHLSDPHFGTERPAVCEALLRFAHALAPQAIVLSGDLTQRATAVQFDDARRFCDRLPAVPRLVLPGNHDLPLFDLWRRASDPYGRFAAAFGAEREPRLDLPGLQLTGLDTTRPWRHKHGVIDPSQIDAVASRLRLGAAEDWRIVVAHHPLVVVPPGDVVDRARGHAAALACWAPAGLDAALGGHIHLPYVVPLPFDVTQGRRSWIVQAGTAVSARTRPGVPNSVTVLRQSASSGAAARPDRVAERWDYDATTDGFRCIAMIAMPA